MIRSALGLGCSFRVTTEEGKGTGLLCPPESQPLGGDMLLGEAVPLAEDCVEGHNCELRATNIPGSWRMGA